MSEYNVVTSFQIMIADAVANLEQLISKYRKTIAVLEQGGELGAAKGLQKAKVYLEEYAASVRSEEHTSELQSHSFISYAVFCLKKKTKINI